MFDAASSMPLSQLIDAAYYMRLALERRFRPEDLEKTPIMAGLPGEPGPEEQEMARAWISEIQLRERRPVDQLDEDTLGGYLGQLSELVRKRVQLEFKPDAVRGRQLLDDLRREVPVPAH